MSQNGAGPSEDLMSWRWLLDARPTIIKIIKDHHTYVIVRRPNVLDGPTMTLVMMTLFSRRGGVSLGYRKGAHSLPKQAVVKNPNAAISPQCRL